MTTKVHLPLPFLNDSVQKPLAGAGEERSPCHLQGDADAAEMAQSRVPEPE